MEKNMQTVQLLRKSILIVSFLLGFIFLYHWPLVAQEEDAAPSASVAVVESEIDIDQVAEEDPREQRRSQFRLKPPYKETRTPKPIGEIELTESQIIQLNSSLRRMIETNEQLRQKNISLDKQLRNIRGQRTIEKNRLDSLTLERDAYKQKNKEVDKLRKKLADLQTDLKEDMRHKEEVLKGRIYDLENQLAKKDELPKEPVPAEQVNLADQAIVEDQNKGMELMAMIESLKQEKEEMGRQEAKILYNMGNAYFNRGEYDKALHKYKETVKKKPNDYNAHFNIAFVSGEYLHDHKTALEHYRKYLRLNPLAEDATLVEEKIKEAEIFLRAKINSTLENDLQRSRRETNVW